MDRQRILDDLKTDIVNLNMDRAVDDAKKGLSFGLSPYDLIDQIRAAAEIVGRKWESNEYFITELVAAGSVMKAVTDALKPLLMPEKTKYKGKLIIGSAPGDLHDIGKNLVISIFMGAGFEVIDLGIDVPIERFVETAEREKPTILGISALTSTTMLAMGDVINGLEAAGIRGNLKVIVGGAPVTKPFAKSIGADAYATDAIQGLKICNAWTSK